MRVCQWQRRHLCESLRGWLLVPPFTRAFLKSPSSRGLSAIAELLVPVVYSSMCMDLFQKKTSQYLFSETVVYLFFWATTLSHIITAWRRYASVVLGVIIWSVRLSVTRVLCDKTKQCTADILMPNERTITLVFWHQQWLVGDAPSVWNLCWKWPTPFE